MALCVQDILMDPYQPCEPASSLSPCNVCAYAGWRSSRRGGCTLIMLLAAPPGFVGRNPPLTLGGVTVLPLSTAAELIVAASEGATIG